MRAASSNAFGILSMNCRAMKIAIASAARGRMTAQIVSTRRRFTTTRNDGTNVTWAGITIVTRNAPKSTLRPRNSNLAKA